MPRWTVSFVNKEKIKIFIKTKLTAQMMNNSITVLSAHCLNMTKKDITVAINVNSNRTVKEASESMSGNRPPTTPRTK